MRHVTLQLTHGTWLVVNIVSKCQVPSSNGLGFMLLWIFGRKGLVNLSISYKGVCRTARATPGLLKKIELHREIKRNVCNKVEPIGKMSICLYLVSGPLWKVFLAENLSHAGQGEVK